MVRNSVCLFFYGEESCICLIWWGSLYVLDTVRNIVVLDMVRSLVCSWYGQKSNDLDVVRSLCPWCGEESNVSLIWWDGHVLFNNTLNTFYLRLYGIRHMVKDHSDSKRGNPLPPHGLLFPISSKGPFICIIPQTGYHIPQPLLHQLWRLAGTRNSLITMGPLIWWESCIFLIWL